MKTTPGPWRWTADDAGPDDEWDCPGRGDIDILTYGAKGYSHNPELVGADGEIIISGGSGEYNPLYSNPQDGLLIAAAPELRDALRALVYWAGCVVDSDDDCVALGIAETLLARIDGG